MTTFMGVNSSGTLIGLIQMFVRSISSMLNTKKKRKFALLFLVAISLLSFMVRDDTDAVVEQRLTQFYGKFNLSVEDFGHWNEWNESRQSPIHLYSGNGSSRFQNMIKNRSRTQPLVVAENRPRSIIGFNFLTNQNASKENKPAREYVPKPVLFNGKDIAALPVMKIPNAPGKRKKKEDQYGKSESKNVKIDSQIEETVGLDGDVNHMGGGAEGIGGGEKRREEQMNIPPAGRVVGQETGADISDGVVKLGDIPKGEEPKPVADVEGGGEEELDEIVKMVQDTRGQQREDVTGEEAKPRDAPNEGPKLLVIPDAPVIRRNPDSAQGKGPDPLAIPDVPVNQGNQGDSPGKAGPMEEDIPKVPKKSLKDKYNIGNKGGGVGGGRRGGERVEELEKKPDNIITDQQGRRLKKELYDLAPEVFDFVPTEFELDITSPCWNDDLDLTWCLPHYYIIGMPDAGSENLRQKLAKHPGIVDTPVPGYNWWNRGRAREKDNILESFKKFIHNGNGVIEAFEKDNFNMVYGDHSTSLFWDNHWWNEFYPGFKEAPPFTTADILGAVQPKAKLLIILTEPAETVYQNYLITKGGEASPEDFDERCANSIDIYEECLGKKSPRTCIYQPFDAKDKTIRLQWGFLSQYFEDWLKVFRLSQFHIIEKHSFEKTCLVELPKIFSFLKLERLSMRKIREICQTKSVLTRVLPPDSKPMQDSTKELLDAYYTSYFDKLDELLQKVPQ